MNNSLWFPPHPPSFPLSPNQNSNCNPSQVSVLMSRQAQHHPAALTRTPHTLAQVLSAPSVAPVTGILECARRSDGGAAVLLASTRFLVAHGLQNRTCPVVISGAEASGPLFPPTEISESMFSCDDAAKAACVRSIVFHSKSVTTQAGMRKRIWAPATLTSLASMIASRYASFALLKVCTSGSQLSSVFERRIPV